MKGTPLFEHDTCGRCGGSGHYSYNQIHGTVCYGCNGHGVKLTRRGQAAQRLFNELLSKPVEQVVVGDRIRIDSMGRVAAHTVTAITSDGQYPGLNLHLEGPCCRSYGVLTGERVRVIPTREERQVAIDKALAFQGTLTKLGKPRKVAA
jgi:hypothetical protein